MATQNKYFILQICLQLAVLAGSIILATGYEYNYCMECLSYSFKGGCPPLDSFPPLNSGTQMWWLAIMDHVDGGGTKHQLNNHSEWRKLGSNPKEPPH